MSWLPILVSALWRRKVQFLVILAFGIIGMLLGTGSVASFVLGAAGGYVSTIADDMQKLRRRMRRLARTGGGARPLHATIPDVTYPALDTASRPRRHLRDNQAGSATSGSSKRLKRGQLRVPGIALLVVLTAYALLNLALWLVFRTSH